MLQNIAGVKLLGAMKEAGATTQGLDQGDLTGFSMGLGLFVVVLMQVAKR
jgi:hypothetical protein